MLRSPSPDQQTRRHLAASVLLMVAASCSGPPRVYAGGPICLPNPDSSTQDYDPNPISPGVVMEPLCGELAEPTVRVSVLPHFQPTVELIDTSGEKFHFGYVCEGSFSVSRNLTRYLPRGLSNMWTTDYMSGDAVNLAVGDTCVFFSCYEYTVSSFQDGKVVSIVHLVNLNNTSCVIDLNECAHGLARCDHDCVDIRDGSPNSYFCTCRHGFGLSQDLHSCYDVNECETGEHNCDQICTADGDSGWFNCSCRDGFTMGEDGHTCIDIDECETMNGTMLCQTQTTGRECTNTPGSYQCLCQEGFEFSAQQNMCTDIDECTEGTSLCQQGCDNTEGGYNCSCRTQWYIPDGQYNCTAMDVCTELAVSCDGHSSCVNSPDSEEGYRCVCDSGYRQDGNSCSVIGIVHVYWVGGVALLILSLVLLGVFFLLRHKYLQNKHDIQKRYGALFRYNMKKEKVNPSYAPIDFSPMRPISYTFSLMSTLELYGYSSHHSLREISSDELTTAEGKLFSQNVRFITPSGDEENLRVRRELSAIVEDREDNVSEEKRSENFFPDQDSESIGSKDLRTSAHSGYVEDAQNMYQSPGQSLSCGAMLASAIEEEHVVAYVEEQVLEIVSTSTSKAGNIEAGDYIDGINTHAIAKPREKNENQLTQDAQDSPILNSVIPTTEDSRKGVDSPLPEPSADTVPSVHPAPATFHQFTQTSTAVTSTTGSTDASGYIICEEGNPSFVTPTSYVTESGTATSSESSGYASEYISDGKGVLLSSQVCCNSHHHRREFADKSTCAAPSDYVGDGGQCSLVNNNPPSETMQPLHPLFSEDHLQKRSLQDLHSQINTPPPDSYINSELSGEDSSFCSDDVIAPVQSVTACTNGTLTASGYVPYLINGNTHPPPAAVSSQHLGYVADTTSTEVEPIRNGESCIPLSMKSHQATLRVADSAPVHDVSRDKDSLKDPSVESRVLDYEPCVEIIRMTMQEDVASSSGYIETSQLHFIPQPNHITQI